jgi:hypothetical protein
LLLRTLLGTFFLSFLIDYDLLASQSSKITSYFGDYPKRCHTQTRKHTMNLIKATCVAALVTLFVLAPSIRASGEAGGSAQQFVQSFYNWYVPFAARSKVLACEAAMNERPQYFNAVLYRALKKDTTKQENLGGLQGIGFDPFLNSQDPASKYAVGNVRRDGDHYMVDVYGLAEARRDRELALTARVKSENGHWVFTDFLYPGRSSLKKLLHAEGN